MITIAPYHPKVLQRAWGEEIFVAETPHYLGKVLRMKAGTAGGLQYHVEKDETFHLVSGRALVRFDKGAGLETRLMLPGESFHIPPGAVHQVEALDACVFFEASTPHYDDRVRCEAQYGLPESGGLPTTR
jgi:mannose-6-phosphate isomerase